jgi:peptidoglycan/LPS O-acetylase OafA/YrhL
MGHAPRNGDSSYRPDLEGLRGLAILLVLLCHVRLPGAEAGLVGVDVFFVLSGFLITGLLVNERERTGRIRLGPFYARRARTRSSRWSWTVTMTRNCRAKRWPA